MKPKKFLTFSLLFITLLGLSGCAHYAARPLNRLTTDAHSLHEQFISFSHCIFSRGDCMRYLDRNVRAQGFQPIHITFTNNSDRFLYISVKNFSFPCISAAQVAQSVHTSTTKRAIGYGIAGIFIWPLLIPAIVDGVGSSEANKQLDADFAHKSLRDQIVGPYNTIDGLVFVPLEYFDEEFSFILIDHTNHDRFILSTYQTQLKI